jgi:predicted DNA-binding WGR domain protein
MKKYFEYIGVSEENESGTSAKFWEVTLAAKTVSVRYGRIGTDGQVSVKEFATEEEAQKYADKKIADKLKDGYLEK